MLYILILLALMASGSFLWASVQSEKNQELNKKLDAYILTPMENYKEMVCLIQKKSISYTCKPVMVNLNSKMILRHRREEHLVFFWYDISTMSKEDLTKRALHLIAQYYPTYLTRNEYLQYIENPEKSKLETVEVGLLEDYLKTNPLSNDKAALWKDS
jgi:hypothetical protein